MMEYEDGIECCRHDIFVETNLGIDLSTVGAASLEYIKMSPLQGSIYGLPGIFYKGVAPLGLAL